MGYRWRLPLRKSAGGFSRGLFCALFLGRAGGMACGAFCAGRLSLLSQGRALPLLFSGIPVPGYGFLSCITTLLLNLSLWLCLLFLSSLSLAGLGLIPLLLLAKGFLLGLGTLVLLEAEPLWGPAVWFAPRRGWQQSRPAAVRAFGLSVFLPAASGLPLPRGRAPLPEAAVQGPAAVSRPGGWDLPDGSRGLFSLGRFDLRVKRCG